jgi:hypothetical protein
MPSSISGSVAADGNVLVLATAAAGIADINAPTATELDATGVKDITYDLTASGFTWTTAEESVGNERFTLKQVLALPGRRTVTISLQYVYGATDDLADTLFVEGTDFIIAVRWAKDHDTAVAAADKFDLIKVRAGHKSKDAPAANGQLSKTQVFYPLGVAVEDKALV